MNSNHCDQQLITEHYEEYSREYQKAVVNLEKFNSKTKDLIIETYRNTTEKNNHNHAGTLKKLLICLQILQKLNQDLTFADQHQNLTVTSTTLESPDEIYCDECQTETIDQELPLPILSEPDQIIIKPIESSPAKLKQNSLIDHEHPGKHFIYPQPEIHLYAKGHEGICVISYVRKVEYKKSFFIVDNSMVREIYTGSLSKLANLSFELKMRSNWIPDVKDVFGVFIDNCLFRAVKQTETDPNDRSFKILLIDIGEIFDIDIGKNDLYDLPKDIRIMPAQGLYCIIDKKSTLTINNIKDGLYKERTFRITKIKKSTFHLDDIKEITNPFYTELVSEKINASKIYDTSSANTHVNGYLGSSDDYNLSGSDTSNISSNKTDSSEKTSITVEPNPQPAFIETKSTSSAIEAVMTFRPTDDQRICHFYDHRTRSCFKGPNCKLQHLPDVEGGWSRDKVETKTKIAAELEYPDIDSFITVIPTFVEFDGSFWAQIEFGSQISKSFTKLKELNLHLNSPEYVLNYKELDHIPVYSELVLAQFCADNLWYRARIIGDYEHKFKVFFLDYGNCDFITLDRIRKWDNRSDYLPFQAVRCRFANVSIKQENYKQKLDTINKLILNKRMTAIVLNNLCDLDVIILDSNGADIGNMLVANNLATQRKMIAPVYGKNLNPVPQ